MSGRGDAEDVVSQRRRLGIDRYDEVAYARDLERRVTI